MPDTQIAPHKSKSKQKAKPRKVSEAHVDRMTQRGWKLITSEGSLWMHDSEVFRCTKHNGVITAWQLPRLFRGSENEYHAEGCINCKTLKRKCPMSGVRSSMRLRWTEAGGWERISTKPDGAVTVSSDLGPARLSEMTDDQLHARLKQRLLELVQIQEVLESRRSAQHHETIRQSLQERDARPRRKDGSEDIASSEEGSLDGSLGSGEDDD